MNEDYNRAPVERGVIRKILEDEIISYRKSGERNMASKAFFAAARDNAMEQAIRHALFVLSIKCGV